MFISVLALGFLLVIFLVVVLELLKLLFELIALVVDLLLPLLLHLFGELAEVGAFNTAEIVQLFNLLFVVRTYLLELFEFMLVDTIFTTTA